MVLYLITESTKRSKLSLVTVFQHAIPHLGFSLKDTLDIPGDGHHEKVVM